MRVTKRQLRRLIRESVRLNEGIGALSARGAGVTVDNFRGDSRVGVTVPGEAQSGCMWVHAQDRVASDGVALDDQGEPQFGLCVDAYGPHGDLATTIAASQPGAGGGLIHERTGKITLADPGLVRELEQMGKLKIVGSEDFDDDLYG
tara:strand:+ start:1074 stop:1514 length:441 start_codon:yes stop_codon:yes gene_type:complete